MSIRKGRRFVKVTSPLSVLAVGLVCASGGLATMFMGNFFPDELITPIFRTVFFWFGVYLLAVGIPSIGVFIHTVLSPPADLDDISGTSFESLLGWFIGITVTLGPMTAGILMFLQGGELVAPGIVLALIGLVLLLIALPVWFVLSSTPTPIPEPAKNIKITIKKK